MPAARSKKSNRGVAGGGEKTYELAIEEVILACEEVLEKEREAWLSTSMATKLLSESSEQDGTVTGTSSSRDAGGGVRAKAAELTAN